MNMNARKSLLLKIIHAVKCVIDGSVCNTYTEDMYIDFGCENITKTSIIDIAYNRIDEMIARLILDGDIYIARILDYSISDKPIIIFSTNPYRYPMIDETVMKFSSIESKVCLSYANNPTKSNK